MPKSPEDELRKLALKMRLYGLLANWGEVASEPWLPKLLMFAFIAKIVASFARWGMVEFLYGGFGDSIAYHDAGVLHAPTWRSLMVPEIIGRSMGTRFVENVTALFYAPHIPHILGGFFMFASVAFLGQVLYYLAYRRVFGDRLLLGFGMAVFFFPTLLFWPSSIGKDALMTAFLGVAVYGAVRLFEAYQFRWLVVLGLGLWGASVIRSHVAALVGGALLIAVLVGRSTRGGIGVNVRRLMVLGAMLTGALLVLALFAETFGLGTGGDGPFAIDLSLEDLDPVVSDVGRRTGQGGSAVAASDDALSPIALLGAFPRVMFAPYPWQAFNAQAMLAAIEGVAILGIFLWALPAIVRSVPSMRRHPALRFGLVYLIGFVAAFSTILNLGIMTRQRGQVMGVYLLLCFGARALSGRRQEATEPRSVTPVRTPLVTS